MVGASTDRRMDRGGGIPYDPKSGEDRAKAFRPRSLPFLLHGSALFLSLFDELIVDVGDVGDVDDLVAAVLEVAAQGIEDDERAGVADVDIVVDGGAADVDAVLARHLRHELFLLAGQGVKDLHS